MGGAVLLADVGLDLDDPGGATIGAVIADETSAEESRTGIQRRSSEDRAEARVDVRCHGPVSRPRAGISG
jgi:hypothetical protein